MDTKQALREKLLAQRESLTKQQCQQAAQAVCEVIVNHPLFAAATDIAFYFPVNNELDTLPLLQVAIQQGKKCYLPALDASKKDNENTNGLIREFLPKSSDLSIHSQEKLGGLAALLNRRPRKVLNFSSPSDVFDYMCINQESKLSECLSHLDSFS